MKNMSLIGLNLAIFATVFGLAGCGATGGAFQNLQKPENNNSTVYFYRPNKFLGGGMSINIMEIHDSHAVGKHIKSFGNTRVSFIGKLRNNSYIKKEFNPGVHRFTTNWMFDPDEFYLKPNDYICIRADMKIFKGMVSYTPIKTIDKNACASEIKNTNEITKDDEDNILY